VATDTINGTAHTILFDRATAVPLYIVATTAPPTLTTAQTTAVKTSLAAYAAANYNLGTQVVALALRAAGIVPGVTTDVPSFALGAAPSPTLDVNILSAACRSRRFRPPTSS
jgi:hypothetical protein